MYLSYKKDLKGYFLKSYFGNKNVLGAHLLLKVLVFLFSCTACAKVCFTHHALSHTARALWFYWYVQFLIHSDQLVKICFISLTVDPANENQFNSNKDISDSRISSFTLTSTIRMCSCLYLCLVDLWNAIRHSKAADCYKQANTSHDSVLWSITSSVLEKNKLFTSAHRWSYLLFRSERLLQSFWAQSLLNCPQELVWRKHLAIKWKTETISFTHDIFDSSYTPTVRNIIQMTHISKTEIELIIHAFISSQLEKLLELLVWTKHPWIACSLFKM